MATEKQQSQKEQPARPQQPQTEGISERVEPKGEERTQPTREETDPYRNYRESAGSKGER